MSFRLVPKSVTLNDLERRNGRIHCVISLFFINLCSNTEHVTASICGGIYARVYTVGHKKHTKMCFAITFVKLDGF